MKIKELSIKNFRGIGVDGLNISFDNFNLLIGDNGTSKTAILEALNLCLSSGRAASKLSISDFFQGQDDSIELRLMFAEPFDVEIPDIFSGVSQKIQCNGIALDAKKRDKAAPGRAFNDLVVVEHYFLPTDARSADGWTIPRKSGTTLKITERNLSLSNASADYPHAFYFGKDRERQLKRGYSSSIGNVLDELNWRFEKGQRGKPDADKFKHKRAEIEETIFTNTEGDALKKTIDQTNAALKEIGMPPIELGLLKTLTPYEGAEVVQRFDGFEIPISLAGSGVAMISALIFLETLAVISKGEVCFIIDEPELHLHPTLQDKLAQHLSKVSGASQVFVSTHSPFFFKNTYLHAGAKITIMEASTGKLTATDAKSKGFGLLKWSPSWGEICYFAYNLPTVEFHDDLYASLQDKNGKERIAELETWLLTKGQTKEVKWPDPVHGPQEETLMTYIRNRIHHADNASRPMYTPEQLAESIKRMIGLL